MNEVFNYRTTQQIDAKLHFDILAHEDKIEKICIIVFFIIIFLIRGWIFYWLKFGMPIPSAIDTKPISTTEEPIQINYTEEEKARKTFTYTSLINNHKIQIIPQAHYKISGLTVAYNHDFVFISEFFDSAALYDIGLTWGKLGKKSFYNKYFRSYSAKTETTGSRILWTEYKTYPAPVSTDYARSHWSHSHIVPANRNIMAAMLKIKTWDKVELEGDLIDMKYKYRNNRIKHYQTSMSRTDIEPGDHGDGSCETIYVTKVKVGNFIYK